jgi:hypothetical protein
LGKLIPDYDQCKWRFEPKEVRGLGSINRDTEAAWNNETKVQTVGTSSHLRTFEPITWSLKAPDYCGLPKYVISIAPRTAVTTGATNEVIR